MTATTRRWPDTWIAVELHWARRRLLYDTPYSMALEPVGRTETLTEAVYAQIHEGIVSRTLEPGARLTEAGIAQQLNVSKTPVREALLRLREIGLIESDGGRSNRVITPSPATLRDAYETRRVLESFTAQVAAKRAEPQVKQTIRALADETLRHAEANHLPGFRDADRQFHRQIAQSAGNARVSKIVADAATLILALRERDLPNAEAVIDCGRAHVRIAAAIELGDPLAAGDEMSAHLLRVEQYILDVEDHDGSLDQGQ